jgi:hypothetical protein
MQRCKKIRRGWGDVTKNTWLVRLAILGPSIRSWSFSGFRNLAIGTLELLDSRNVHNGISGDLFRTRGGFRGGRAGSGPPFGRPVDRLAGRPAARSARAGPGRPRFFGQKNGPSRAGPDYSHGPDRAANHRPVYECKNSITAKVVFQKIPVSEISIPSSELPNTM